MNIHVRTKNMGLIWDDIFSDYGHISVIIPVSAAQRDSPQGNHTVSLPWSWPTCSTSCLTLSSCPRSAALHSPSCSCCSSACGRQLLLSSSSSNIWKSFRPIKVSKHQLILYTVRCTSCCSEQKGHIDFLEMEREKTTFSHTLLFLINKSLWRVHRRGNPFVPKLTSKMYKKRLIKWKRNFVLIGIKNS